MAQNAVPSLDRCSVLATRSDPELGAFVFEKGLGSVIVQGALTIGVMDFGWVCALE